MTLEYIENLEKGMSISPLNNMNTIGNLTGSALHNNRNAILNLSNFIESEMPTFDYSDILNTDTDNDNNINIERLPMIGGKLDGNYNNLNKKQELSDIDSLREHVKILQKEIDNLKSQSRSSSLQRQKPQSKVSSTRPKPQPKSQSKSQPKSQSKSKLKSHSKSTEKIRTDLSKPGIAKKSTQKWCNDCGIMVCSRNTTNHNRTQKHIRNANLGDVKELLGTIKGQRYTSLSERSVDNKQYNY